MKADKMLRKEREMERQRGREEGEERTEREINRCKLFVLFNHNLYIYMFIIIIIIIVIIIRRDRKIRKEQQCIRVEREKTKDIFITITRLHRVLKKCSMRSNIVDIKN